MIERFVIALRAHRANEIGRDVVQRERHQLVVIELVVDAHAHRAQRRGEIRVRREDEVSRPFAAQDDTVATQSVERPRDGMGLEPTAEFRSRRVARAVSIKNAWPHRGARLTVMRLVPTTPFAVAEMVATPTLLPRT